ncbi:MAG TPA: LysM domain-containing protein [Gaiellaceae bacterium]
MALQEWRAPLARYVAPAAFLVAATVAALLIRAGLNGGDHRTSTGSTVTTVTESLPHGAPVYYRIRSGDTLGAVAERFHTSVDILRSLNPRVDPNSLRIGQRLRVR